MNQYLEEAAQLLRKASSENETLHDPARASRGLESSFRRDLIQGRERIAMKFAQLGAIEAGVIPTEMIQDLLVAVTRGESR